MDDLDERLQQGVDTLAAYDADELLTILQALLQNRTDVLQNLVDWATPDHCYGSARAVIGLRYTGVIKSFSARHGYGFIASEEIAKAFGMDLLVSDKQIRSFNVGEEVEFAILLNKGKPQAFDLAHPRKAEKGMKGAGSWNSAGKGTYATGNGKGAGSWDYGGMSAAGDDWGWSAPVKGGQKSWTPSLGKGAAAGYGGWGARDTWYPADEGLSGGAGYAETSMAGPADAGAVGSKGGKRKGSQREVPGVTDIRWMGTVKSFKEGKFGFLTCGELQDMYGGQEIYVHWDQMRGFAVGSSVSFAVIVNEANRLKAIDLWSPDDNSSKRARFN